MEQSFIYRALDANSKIIEGSVEAESENEVLTMIRARGHVPVKVNLKEAQSKEISLKFLKGKVTSSDMAIFCKQVSTMLTAGLSINRALEVMENQTKKATLKSAIRNLLTQIKQGMSLSQAMRSNPKVFSPLLVSLIASSELTGRIDDAFANMSVHFTKENKINHRIKGAMTYPIILFLLTIIIVVGMLIFVVPMFVTMFETGNAELPGLTQVLIAVSNSMRIYWYIYIGVAALIVFGVRAYITSEEGRKKIDGFKLKMKVIKGPMQQIITARFTRTMSTLIECGVPVVGALKSSAESTNNKVVEEKIENVAEGVQRGSSISAELTKVELFPDMMVSMVAIGEETGEIDTLLFKAAEYYDEELEAGISRLLSLIEPIMILFMAVFVGLIMIAIMLPMFDMSSAFNQ